MSCRSLYRALSCLLLTLLPARAGLTPAELEGALDSGGSLTWQAAPATWSVVTGSAALDGVDAVQAPPLIHGNYAVLMAAVTGPGLLRGRVRVSSERFHDTLTVDAGDGLPVSYSGEVTEGFELRVPRGRRSVSFTWRKDEGLSRGLDTAWLDAVTFTPDAVAPAEALDVAGTAAAGAITISTPAEMTAWRGVSGVESSNGGDALYADGLPGANAGVLLTVQSPGIVSFRSRSGNEDSSQATGILNILQQSGVAQLSGVRLDGWDYMQYLVPQAGGVIRIEYSLPAFSLPGGGYLLDDLQFAPLTTVPVNDALDVPGLTFTVFQTGGQAFRWLSGAGAALRDMGLAHGGTDAVLLNIANEGGSGTVRATVNGPGRLSFWWKVCRDYSPFPWQFHVTLDGAWQQASNGPGLRQWTQGTVDVPPGTHTLQFNISGVNFIALDELTWTPTPRTLPAPSAAQALDLSGGLNLTATGNWSGGQWKGAGMGNDDALVWLPLAEPSAEAPALTATADGAGWVFFAWRGLVEDVLQFSLDGQVDSLWNVLPQGDYLEDPVPWRQVARRVPAGAHSMSWRPNTNTSVSPGDRLRLDALRFAATPPDWVDAIESNGVDRWQQGHAPWPVVTDTTHDGTDALCAPVSGALENATLAAQVDGPGVLRFWARVDDPMPLPDYNGGHNRWDFTSGPFGSPTATVSEPGAWREVVLDLVEPHSYDLRWTFRRSNRDALPGDGGWLDAVSFTPELPVTLAEALDAPDFTWNAAGAWQPVSAGYTAFTGGDFVRLAAHDAGTWLETTLPGPGRVTLGDASGIDLAFTLNGLPVEAHRDNRWHVQAAGPGPQVLRITPAGAGVQLDAFTFTPLLLLPLAVALDAPASTSLALTGYPDLSGGFAGAADSHDGVDGVRLEATTDKNCTLRIHYPGPAQVRFWWRREGAGYAALNELNGLNDDRYYASAVWEQKTLVQRHYGGQTLEITCDSGDSAVQRVWVDQLVIEPLESMSLAAALHAAPLTFTTGGEGGTWAGLRPPGDDADSYAALRLPLDTMSPAWLETEFTGPGWLEYTAETFGSSVSLTVTRQLVPGGEMVELPQQQPRVLVPPGVQRLRWSAQRTAQWPQPELAATLRDVSFTPCIPAAEALDAPGFTFISTPQPDGFWCGAMADANDAAAFAGEDLLRLHGSAELSFEVTGPGWLRFAAGIPGSWYSSAGMELRLLPPGPAPDPMPAPVWSNMTSGAVYLPYFTYANLPVPAGTWRAVVKGTSAGTLNALSFTPDLDAASAAAALDLTPGLTVALPAPGATFAPVSHDGVDALQVSVPGRGSRTEPLVSFRFTGPGLLTGWLRTGQKSPPSFSPWTTPWIPGRDLYRGIDYVTILLDGQPVLVRWPEQTVAEEWLPLRLPITAPGPHTVGFAMEYNSKYEELPIVLQLDGMALLPLTPVPLAQALDAPGLTWTAGGEYAWTGWASPVASPDATDAAWVSRPPGWIEEPPFLETTLTGPGVLSFSQHGESLLTLSLAGQEKVLYSSNEHAESWDRWTILIPPGPQTIRLTAPGASSETLVSGLDEVAWQPVSAVSLHEAIDAPAGTALSLTGSAAVSLAAPVFSHDGVDALLVPASHTEPVELTATIAGPAYVSFWHKQLQYVSFTVNDAPWREYLNTSGGVIDHGVRGVSPPATGEALPWPRQWSREELLLPAREHVLRWIVIPGGYYPPGAVAFGLDELCITPLPPAVSLAEAIDQPGWTVSSTRPDKVAAVSGPDAWDSTDAVLLTGESRYDVQPALTATVPGPGVLHYRSRLMAGSRPRISFVAPGGTIESLPPANEDTTWISAWAIIPNSGPATVSWDGYGEGHGVWLDDVRFEPAQPPGPTAGDASLTWSTGGTAAWFGVPARPSTAPATPLPAAAVTGVKSAGDSWLEAEITGPGRLTYSTRTSVNHPATEDAVRGMVFFDGQPLETGAEFDQRTLVVPPGTHRVRWTLRLDHSYDKLAASMKLQGVKFTPSAGVDLIAEALDAPALPWLFAGSSTQWERQTLITGDGADALRTTTPGAWLSTVLPQPGAVAFNAREDGGLRAAPNWNSTSGRWRGVRTYSYGDYPRAFVIKLSADANVTPPGPGAVYFDQFSYTPINVPLGEALDAPGQTWETSATQPLIGYGVASSYLTQDGSDAAMARNGEPGAWLQTTSTGPALVTFYTFGNGGEFLLDGLPVAPGSGSPWAGMQIELPPGLHTLRWVKTGYGPWAVDAFNVTPLAAGSSLAEALDFPGPWLTGPITSWILSGTDTHDGQDAAFLTGYGQSISGYVNGPGRLQFQRKSSRIGDLTESLLVTAGGRSWRVPCSSQWTAHTIDTIPPGRQRLDWTVDGGTLGLDAVSFTPYIETPLAAALDAEGTIIATDPAAPWRGWQTGTAALDGSDAAIGASWLDVTVSGPGNLRFFARSPGLNGARFVVPPQFGPDLNVPAEWKEFILPVTASGLQTIRLEALPGGDMWLDLLSFTSAQDQLNAWLARHGVPANASLQSDFDGDGIVLLMEYAFGLDPNVAHAPDAASPAGVTAPDFSLEPYWNSWSRSLRFRFLGRAPGSGLSYEVLFTGDPAAFTGTTATSIYTERPAPEGWRWFDLADASGAAWPTATKRFGRVRVTFSP